MHLLASAKFNDPGMRAMLKTAEAGIDQTPCNCLALRQAARHLTQLYDRHLAEVKLRSTQYSILSKLNRLGAMPIGKLAETMVIERTALSRTLGPLEREKLVAIDSCPDARTRTVRLTPKGEARFKAAAIVWRRAQKEFESAYGVDAARNLRGSLQRVVEAA
jgi:DNA-binding MarR family transcriptional regulator